MERSPSSMAKCGTDYLPEFSRDCLINTVLPEQDKCRSQTQLPVYLPSRGKGQQLGKRTVDGDMLDKRRAGQEKKKSEKEGRG